MNAYIMGIITVVNYNYIHNIMKVYVQLITDVNRLTLGIIIQSKLVTTIVGVDEFILLIFTRLNIFLYHMIVYLPQIMSTCVVFSTRKTNIYT